MPRSLANTLSSSGQCNVYLYFYFRFNVAGPSYHFVLYKFVSSCLASTNRRFLRFKRPPSFREVRFNLDRGDVPGWLGQGRGHCGQGDPAVRELGHRGHHQE